MKKKNAPAGAQTQDAPAQDENASARGGKLKRRVLLAALLLFVCGGTAVVTVLMSSVLPTMYREQATEQYAPVLQQANVGDVIKIGKYEQNDDTSDGSEPIEWLVIARENDRLLLISRYALECLRFNTTDKLATWDYSTIFEWLNSTFFYEAFSPTERTLVLRSEIPADQNPFFNSDPGKDTVERLFLLSIPEAYQYFNSEDARRCEPTKYTLAKGARVTDGKCVWWLRSPGFDASVAARVMADGRINYCGFHVNSDDNAVRPAMWVALDAYTAAS